MSWASDRETTRTEDGAYCLLGIFGINLPLLYGEGRKAFIRLQEEIIRQTDDHSILAWKANDQFGQGGSLSDGSLPYKDCGKVKYHPLPKPVEPFSVTSRGIRVQLPIISPTKNSRLFHGHSDYFAALACCYDRNLDEYITIGIRPVDNQVDVFSRVRERRGTASVEDISRAELRTIFLLKDTIPPQVETRGLRRCWIRNIEIGKHKYDIASEDLFLPGIPNWGGWPTWDPKIRQMIFRPKTKALITGLQFFDKDNKGFILILELDWIKRCSRIGLKECAYDRRWESNTELLKTFIEENRLLPSAARLCFQNSVVEAQVRISEVHGNDMYVVDIRITEN
jgi:hypothetical protein